MSLAHQTPATGATALPSKDNWLLKNWGLLLAVFALIGIMLLPKSLAELGPIRHRKRSCWRSHLRFWPFGPPKGLSTASTPHRPRLPLSL
jgi:hypothetical protein